MALNRRIVALIVLCIPILTLGFTAPSSVAVRRFSTTNLFANKNDNESLSSYTSNDSININRRSAIQQTSGVALSSLLLGTSAVFSPQTAYAAETYEDTKKKQRILITGCNSGIGFNAAERLAMRGHEIVLACVSFLLLLWCLCVECVMLLVYV